MSKLTERDVERIISLYTTPNEEGLYPRASELAKQFSVSTATIGRALNAAGISGVERQGSNNRKLSSDDIFAIIELYSTRLPNGTWRGSHEIAEQFGVTFQTVLRHLRKSGVSIRTSGETQRGHAHPITRKPPDSEAPPLCKCGCGGSVGWQRTKDRWYKYLPGHYRPKRKYHDELWLRREYVVKGRSAIDIASQFCVNRHTIYRRLIKYGIARRSTGESLILSGATRGANNPAWKGGVADWDYAFNWKSICKTIKDRDGWTCQLCGEQRKRWGHNLHVHHINEDKTDNHNENLVSLCAPCHRSVHRDKAIADQLCVLLHIVPLSKRLGIRRAPHT